MPSSNAYGWMPGWLKKFLNLDDDLPNYGAGSYRPQADYAPPTPAPVRYTPPSQSSYTPSQGSYTPSQGSYTPSQGSYTPSPSNTWQRSTDAPSVGSYRMTTPMSDAAAQTGAPPPLSSRVAGTPVNGNAGAGNGGAVLSDGTVSPAGPMPEGYVQPVGYAVRSYARGALPPQGLEQFTREFRATLTDVWNFYSYWTRFQTDELVRIGREAVDTVVPPATNGEGNGGTTVRRIKVAVANGEKKTDPSVAPVVAAVSSSPEVSLSPEVSPSPVADPSPEVSPSPAVSPSPEASPVASSPSPAQTAGKGRKPGK